MSVGKYTFFVQLRDIARVREKDFGQPREHPTPYATAWASIEDIDGSETTAGLQRQAVRKVTVRLRFRTDVKAGHQVHHRGRVLNIVAARDEQGRQRELVLDCIEQTMGAGP